MAMHNRLLASLIQGIRDVNQKYRKPKIEITPLVKVSLFVLRLYLIALVGLMIFKFAMAARG